MDFELSDDLRRHHGIPADWRFGFSHQVRWADADAFGHANHRAYLGWFEDARNLYLEWAGLPRLTAATPGPVLSEVTARYLAPLSYGDRIVVTARTLSLRRTSFRMEYAAWGQGCAAVGTALCVLMVNATGERVPIPDAVRARMIERDGAAEE